MSIVNATNKKMRGPIKCSVKFDAKRTTHELKTSNAFSKAKGNPELF